jgi:leucyl aminopeptidase
VRELVVKTALLRDTPGSVTHQFKIVEFERRYCSFLRALIMEEAAMDVKVVVGAIQEAKVDAIVVSLFEGAGEPGGAAQAVDDALGGAIRDLIAAEDFTGKAGLVAILYSRGALPAKRVIIVGLGPQADFAVEGVRRAAAQVIRSLRELNVAQVATVLHGAGEGGLTVEAAAQAVAEGSLMAAYVYKFKPGDERVPEMLNLMIPDADDADAARRGAEAGSALAGGVALTRDLVNLPPNICTPAYLADAASKAAAETGMRIQVLERGQMQALGMGALLAVAQGSDTPPRFIILEHNPERAEELPSIVLVGKGVTFDTGGYNLKSGEGMARMKTDMAGGAAVIGAMQAIAALKTPLHVVGLVPASDNMINGSAYRTSEVVTASDGTTIEIVSTDAEGRMLLADALVFAARFKPAAVVDIATLTGACVVALGAVAAGLFASDDSLRDRLLAASETSNEKLWPLPLFPEYEKTLESQVADLKHSGGRMGGVGASAMFLKHFTSYPWAHVDMAGLAANGKDAPYFLEGATGYGVRLLAEFVRGWARQTV